MLSDGYQRSFSGVQRPDREADHLRPSRTQGKNEWSYTSTASWFVCVYIYIYIYVCVCVGFRTFLRCPTPKLHSFLSSHWPSFRFLSFIAFVILSVFLVLSFVLASTSVLSWPVLAVPCELVLFDLLYNCFL